MDHVSVGPGGAGVVQTAGCTGFGFGAGLGAAYVEVLVWGLIAHDWVTYVSLALPPAWRLPEGRD